MRIIIYLLIFIIDYLEDNMNNVKHVTDDIIWVGGNDRRIALFEGVYPLTKGVSYNSYIVLDEKTVLFDTVDKAISSLFFENIEKALGGRTLDYFVIQHLEPDHAANIAEVLRRYPDVSVICNAKAAAMIKQFFGITLAGSVKEGDTLCTGRHTFTFVNAPMVHWPEVMMTYDTTDKILFSADAFGTFGAQNGALFADEVDFDREYLDEARRYYTNIVGKYGPQVQAVLGKASGLEIKMLCPLHGFVWRDNIGYILEKYIAWSTYTPEKNAVLIIYGSIYGNTENAAELLAGALRRKGVKTYIYDASVTHYSELLASCFQYSHIVLACPTYNNGLYTPIDNLINVITAHNLQNRMFGFIENGTWAPVSAKLMHDKLAALKNTSFADTTVTFKSSPDGTAVEAIEALASELASSFNK